jgi:hypothetical protein
MYKKEDFIMEKSKTNSTNCGETKNKNANKNANKSSNKNSSNTTSNNY